MSIARYIKSQTSDRIVLTETNMVAMTSRDEEIVEQTEAFKKKEDSSYRGGRRKTGDVEEEVGSQKMQRRKKEDRRYRGGRRKTEDVEEE